MKRGWYSLASAVLLTSVTATHFVSAQAANQSTAQNSTLKPHVCECGKNPPPKPEDRTVAPYAGEPEDLRPYSKFAKPYDTNYVHPNIYSGAGRDIPEPAGLQEIRVGFFGPLENNPDSVLGLRMLHGAQLAVEEANARGGYGGTPFKLMLHNDYDNWQAMAVYGDKRPTDPAIWGSSSDEAVKMIYDDQDWAIFGSISSEATHIILRVALRAEIPIVNAASTDPTIPETYIPWYFTNIQDDRVQDLTLARRIFTERGLKRIAIFRVNNRYGRFGVIKFRDAARRLGHPVVIEQKFLPADSDFSRQIQVIKDSRVDGIVIWADQPQTAMALKQLRAAGLNQPVFGSYRTLGPDMLAAAGDTAEGFEAVYPYDPTRNDAAWLDFQNRFEARFHEPTESFSALAYDAMNALLDSICRAGLNRARIHDALAEINDYQGVTGHMHFDPNQKNVVPMFLGTVHNGKVSYRVAPMEKLLPEVPKQKTTADEPDKEKAEPATHQQSEIIQAAQPYARPYARIDDSPIEYNGVRQTQQATATVLFFGPKSATITAELAANGKHTMKLIAVESSQDWGKATIAFIDALTNEQPLAIIALDRDSAHLASQMSLKFFVPVVALSSDKSLTATNIPWIFRLDATSNPEVALSMIESASQNGVRSRDALRTLLASGQRVDGLAFLSTGEPLGR